MEARAAGEDLEDEEVERALEGVGFGHILSRLNN
jgi:hypothetical protein